MTRFRTIVVDPPWPHSEGWPQTRWHPHIAGATAENPDGPRRSLPYSTMTIKDITALPIAAMGMKSAHLLLWTTNRYLREAYNIAESWGFRPSQVVTWCKPPQGIGPGGVFASTSEFILYARRGTPEHLARVPSTWFEWPRTWRMHSAKPDAFLDLVEQAFPGPYLEMFARRARLGWSYWGDESLQTVELPKAAT